MFSRTVPSLVRSCHVPVPIRMFHATPIVNTSLSRVGSALLFTPPNGTSTAASTTGPATSTATTQIPFTNQQTTTGTSTSSEIPFAGSDAHPISNHGNGDPDSDRYNASSWFSFLPFSFPFPLPFVQTPSASSLSQWSTTQQRILENALLHVNEYGWTQQAIVQAAHQLRLSPAITGLFPRGAIELVDYYMITNNEKMSAWMRQQPLHQMKTTEKIKLAVRTRLSLQIPLIHTWPQAQGLGALPQNLPYTLHHLAVMVDEMWHLAGDQATDLNWYSKRGLLAGVYVSTELFMLSDRSLDYISTWDFLDRRLNDVYQIGKLPSQAESLVKSVVSNGSSLFETIGQQVRRAATKTSNSSSTTTPR